MTEVAVFYCFARSGGTLINRCLGCIPGNLVLSEVNPHGSIVSMDRQAKDWLQLIADGEYESFSQKTYGAKIQWLAESAARNRQRLVIRDWPTLNFLDGVFCDYFCPSMILEQEVYLSRYRIPRNAAVVARRSAAVYTSIKASLPHLKDLPVEKFGKAYLAYVRAVTSYPVFQFEKFCRSPAEELTRLCNCLKIEYSDSFLIDFPQFDRCTGDNKLLIKSKGRNSSTIISFPNECDSPTWQDACHDRDCREADELFGYAD